MMPSQRVRQRPSIELFAGVGGLGMGLELAGFEPVAVVEWNHECCETLKINQSGGMTSIHHWPVFERDVRTFDYSLISGNVDLVAGGPPCQPFSLAGRQRGALDSRDMFPEAIRAVRELQPKAFLFENVKGLTCAKFVPYLEYILAGLAFPGQILESEDWRSHRQRRQQGGEGVRYDVSLCVLNAADFGVPQRRERVFIVGFRSDLGVTWTDPVATHSRESLLWSQWASSGYWDRHGLSAPEGDRRMSRHLAHLREPPDTLPWVTVRDALCDLPDPEFMPELARCYSNHCFQPGARTYPGHTGSLLDAPAKTLKAGAHGVPGGENMLVRPDGTVRYFTVRESARLQTFPDSYVFPGTWSESMRQLGNAVPVTLARVVAAAVMERLAAAEQGQQVSTEAQARTPQPSKTIQTGADLIPWHKSVAPMRVRRT